MKSSLLEEGYKYCHTENDKTINLRWTKDTLPLQNGKTEINLFTVSEHR